MDDKDVEQLQQTIAKLRAENAALQKRLSTTADATNQQLSSWLDSCSSATHIEQLDILLGEVAAYLNADGATLSIHHYGSHQLNLVSSYPISSSQEKTRCQYHIDDFPWTWQQLQSGRPLIINKLSDIPSNNKTDIHFYQTLKQPSALQIPLTFEDRIQGILEVHSQGRTHNWSANDCELLQQLSQAFFSAANRILKDKLDREGLQLLQKVAENTGVSYALLNYERSHYSFGRNLASMLGLPCDTLLTPQSFDQQWQAQQLVKQQRWWQDIFQQENTSPLILQWHGKNNEIKYFCCTPSIIYRDKHNKPDTVLVGYTDITQLQTQTLNSQWLSNVLQQLHLSPQLSTINHILSELLKRLNASGVMVFLNQQVITTQTSSDAIVKDIYSDNKAEDINSFNAEIYKLLKKSRPLFFTRLDQAPKSLIENSKYYNILKSIKSQGLYAATFNRQNNTPALIVLTWDENHNIAQLNLIEATLLSIGDTLFSVIDQINDKKALQQKIVQEQWLTTQVDQLYRSRYPIESTVNKVLKALCQHLNAERIFIRHRIENSNIYQVSYQHCEPGIPSIVDSIGANIDLSNLPSEHVLVIGKPIAINDMSGKEKLLAAKKNLVLQEDPVLATLMMPLFGIEGIPAYIAVDCMTHTQQWTKEHEKLVQAVGDAICMAHDRQEIYYQLLNNEQRLSMAMEASQHGMWEWQLDTNSIYISPECSSLFGFQHAERQIYFDSDRFLKRVHDDDQALFSAELDKLQNNQLPFEDIKLRFIKKDHSIIWCYLRAKFTDWDFHGNPKCLIGVMINISDFILQQQALDKARIEAEQANIEKSDFLARMSHEIRTPMNAIIGLSHLMKDSDLNEKQLDYIDHIHSAANNLLGIINDILDFSKIAAGKLIIDNANFYFEETLKQVLRITSFLSDQKSLKLVLVHDDNIPKKLYGDSLRLSQILTNLLSNAVKFTEQGEIILKTQLLNLTGNKVELQINVIDSGMGISDDYIQQLFDPFSQADGSISRRFGGTGLGLTIVQRLATLMGGNIGVVSELGKGTNFTLTLTFELAKQQQPDQSQQQHDHYQQQLRGLHILVAEDNIVNQKVAAGVLNKKGMQYSFANNGQEAIQLMQEHAANYDAILMDIEMPEVNGYQATSYIRHTLGSDIPIIAMTAHAMSGDTEKALAAGMNAHISKPINPNALYQTLSHHVARR
ncbi:ATP-binding protein [Dasania sp. GY-MA-18]|uniref:Sensory/regulatory protein RpfC n=1 Tax=Dasania phycosphaerae TaxID=2950436 RepID=A0A9J6RS04_9GAMM|nr:MULTISPECIES: ATP-binding protein [Dasania]MCR8924382.1 ATP-binding protein [Dasania sp. GY-MA-18]MCZ0867057.1 ATP-binding protein [Dasania phycosphaerae]MCZ0870509.1 ATP-binding protein [Dasania phycosphaerae]